jgi:nitrate reductase (NAD(P)H)
MRCFSNFFYIIPIGEDVDLNGLTDEIEYLGHGRFNIEGKELNFSKVSLILGGSGITSGYKLVLKIPKWEGNKT